MGVPQGNIQVVLSIVDLDIKLTHNLSNKVSSLFSKSVSHEITEKTFFFFIFLFLLFYKIIIENSWIFMGYFNRKDKSIKL